MHSVQIMSFIFNNFYHLLFIGRNYNFPFDLRRVIYLQVELDYLSTHPNYMLNNGNNTNNKLSILNMKLYDKSLDII